MWHLSVPMRQTSMALLTMFFSASRLPAEDIPNVFKAPPGMVSTSWVGNSFGGNGGPNGTGYWVQNAAARSIVTPDGTMIVGIDWDEAGRCVGLYKDGRVNRQLLKAEGGKLPDSAWGWGTGNDGAVAALGNDIFVGTKGKKLLRFRWEPGNIDSVRFVNAVNLPSTPVALSARKDSLAVGYKDRIEYHAAADMETQGGFDLAQLQDAALAADGSIWALAGGKVKHLSAEGKAIGPDLPGLQKPTSISYGNHDDNLYICDDGERQQVLVFSTSTAIPKRIAAIGREGGLYANPAGEMQAGKLFSLRGAGTDRDGNLYVAMSFGAGPCGSLTLRSLTPEGKLRWQLYNQAFVDTFGFDPDSDGKVAYGRLGVFDLDLSKTKPGAEWSLRAISLEHLRHPNDARINGGCTTLVRRMDGRRLMYTIGQYGGGYNIFAFDEPDGLIARRVDGIRVNDTWAWDVGSDGAIWHGDAPKRTIRRYAFGGWGEGGKPTYDWKTPQTWDWPEDFELVRRVHYDNDADSLYIFGYLKGEAIDSWGVVGRTARRYDGWRNGKRILRWTKALPMTPDGESKGKPLSAESVLALGDYLFVGMCKPQDGRQYIHIFNLKDAGYVGSLWPGESVGGQAGWLDMPYAIQGLKRNDGEVLLLVEEDFRGKNLLYRWRP